MHLQDQGGGSFQSSQPLPPHNSLLHDCSLPNLSKVAYMALWKTVGNSWNEMPSCPLTFLLFTVPVYGHNHADTAKQVTNKPFSSLLTLLAKIYLSVPVFSILGKSPTWGSHQSAERYRPTVKVPKKSGTVKVPKQKSCHLPLATCLHQDSWVRLGRF